MNEANLRQCSHFDCFTIVKRVLYAWNPMTRWVKCGDIPITCAKRTGFTFLMNARGSASALITLLYAEFKRRIFWS